jgi:hypothetical protein
MGLLQPHGRGRRAFRRDALSGRDPSPTIVVHSLNQAVAALEAAVAANRAVTLLSAPDAGIYAGAGWWNALVVAARAAAPAARLSAILDCGDQAGAVQAALRAGVETAIFTGRADVAQRLAAIAEQQGARLLTARPEPDLDLLPLFFADRETVRRECADVLASLPAIC